MLSSVGWRTLRSEKVCKIMALSVIFKGLGPLFYLLLGFRYLLKYFANRKTLTFLGFLFYVSILKFKLF